VITGETEVGRILTRAQGYLRTVSSHSLQPYRGCSYGRSLCGVGCYVQHNPWVTAGAPWGTFLQARLNAAEAYAAEYERERSWGRRTRGSFSIFLSSATDPFVPQEERYGVTRRVLETMTMRPPDTLILQTHSRRVLGALDVCRTLRTRCRLRVHISIESDRDRLPGLPPPASSVADRVDAAKTLREAGIFTVVTVSPLLPMEDPKTFFARIADAADAVVVDHFIGGDGTTGGTRTLRTALPEAMTAIDPTSTTLAYRDRIVAIARTIMPGRVGVGIDGFAGRMLPV